jgi:putative FmdB family regulatory protein
MPLYEYRCRKCGEVFEVIQKFSDKPLTVHEKCRGKVERLLSAPALQFKGSGWYITDYARASQAKRDGNGDQPKPAKTETKKETSKETATSSGPSKKNS